jgi:predicted transcriptional regulator of viral defense system
MTIQNRNVRSWIEELPKRGRIVFSMEEAHSRFPALLHETLRSVISRLKKKERVRSIWRGIYVIVPDEYGLRGIVPPIEYIDYLMGSLERGYYVGLLSAAAFQGASHQQPQSLMVVTDSKDLKDSIKDNIAIRFICKSELPKKYLYEKNVDRGKVVLSCPELTSLDLIFYEKRIGGLERAAMVLNELSEGLNYENTDSGFWKLFPRQVIQRLGFILEQILSFSELGETVYRKSKDAGIVFRKSFLDPASKNSSPEQYNFDDRWKLILNAKMETEF